MLEILLDTVKDTLRLLPFLFVTYLLMEYLETKALSSATGVVKKVGRLGPVFGAALGLVPQCGFSAAIASLFSGGIVTLGTLIAVFFSTSDEMIPIMISHTVPAGMLGKILLLKFLAGLVTGLVIDLVLTVFGKHGKKDFHELCEQEDCGCEEGSILKSALTHTFKIWIFIFIVSFVLELVLDAVGFDAIAGFFAGKPFGTVILAALVGLIPNCAPSVVLTECYLSGIFGFGPLMAGLLVNGGMGLLILFRTNKRLKENIGIAVLMLVLGILWGLALGNVM
ncbi:MAG: arsenic efflux protein [Eubacterium sp.]|nr:arsenic efflux protein [Eubacterium sp.]